MKSPTEKLIEAVLELDKRATPKAIDEWPRRIHVLTPYSLVSANFLKPGEVPTNGCVYIKIGEWVNTRTSCVQLAKMALEMWQTLDTLQSDKWVNNQEMKYGYDEYGGGNAGGYIRERMELVNKIAKGES